MTGEPAAILPAVTVVVHASPLFLITWAFVMSNGNPIAWDSTVPVEVMVLVTFDATNPFADAINKTPVVSTFNKEALL